MLQALEVPPSWDGMGKCGFYSGGPSDNQYSSFTIRFASCICHVWQLMCYSVAIPCISKGAHLLTWKLQGLPDMNTRTDLWCKTRGKFYHSDSSSLEDLYFADCYQVCAVRGSNMQ
jgi:hypothetical protein